MIRSPVAFLVAMFGCFPVLADENPSFRNDVMAVLSKAGCNQGVCHGNKFGKAGFKLSLRGQDSAFDYESLTRDMSARRTNPLQPDRSLILRKPTMQLAHQGGRRFVVDSPEYHILRDWIAAGMPPDRPDAPRLVGLHVSPQDRVLIDPDDRIRLRVEATFSDGTSRELTRLSVYEPAQPIVEVTADGEIRRTDFGETTVTVRYLDRQVPVRLAFIPARPDFRWDAPPPANYVDEYVFAKLRKLRMNPSPPADDGVFLRRACLDLLGLLPTAEEARRFVADERADKRSRLIDVLLTRPEFADRWALLWSDLLRNEEKTLDRKGVQNFHAWIRQSFAQGKPLDRFARELIASRGSTYKQPAANYYRAMRDPLTRAESTAQLFLGVRLGCAKCHNHPFDRWTQDDYYGWANLFARVQYKIVENNRKDRFDKNEFDGEQIVFMADEGEVNHAVTGQPAPPRFLGETTTPVDPDGDRLVQLSEWIAGRENDRFARAQVNRIWQQLMGRGIVDPIDDFRATNPPSNPELLDALADDFVQSGFNLRHMIRVIMNSRTYQLSSVPNDTNRDDVANFSHPVVRRLSAEQMLDALAQVSGAPIEFNGYPLGLRAGQLPGVQAIRPRDQTPSLGDQFLVLFGKPRRLQNCECERSEETTLSQTFQMVSGPLINRLLTREGNRIDTLLAAEKSEADIIDELYWTALTRPPTAEEHDTSLRHLQSADNRRTALEDLLWALLNSNEFILRR